ncbi:MAG: WecB/TagA/CpsF family glycosyltransferase [Lachnospiraceae bacterium]
MNEKITILDIQIDNYTAKRAMQEAMQYMETELVSIIEMVTVELLVYASEQEELRNYIKEIDLLLPRERAVLEATGVTASKQLKEATNAQFLKMFMSFLHKNRQAVFLLAATQDEEMQFRTYLETYYSGIHIVNTAVLSENSTSDDMIINAINGAEVSCVLVALPSPLQMSFAIRNRLALNARVWLGLGRTVMPQRTFYRKKNQIKNFIQNHIWKKELEKKQKEKEN